MMYDEQDRTDALSFYLVRSLFTPYRFFLLPDHLLIYRPRLVGSGTELNYNNAKCNIKIRVRNNISKDTW